MTRPTEPFPESFLWGAATSAYQVEGSPLADGAGPSIWHRFSHTPGRIAGGDTGDVACDQYRRLDEDVAWMARLGLNAYRFSLSWSRLLPDGTGRVNPAGIDFYSRLVDALLARGIQPLATLYHWDLPAALDDRGGWTNPDAAAWFTEYAGLAFDALGDRVAMWATLNEPWVVVDAGYLHGTHAPGHRSAFEATRAAHHLLRAHASAVRAFHAAGRPGRIGIVLNLEPKDPATGDPADALAAARADAQMNRHYLDALFFGRYPAELEGIYGEAWPEFPERELTALREPMDFLGINYYTRGVTRHDDTAWPTRARTVPVPGAEYTAVGWEVHPASLTSLLLRVKEQYADLPVYITENGAAFPEASGTGGGRHDDPRRIAYFHSHLGAVREAMARGVDVRGYFAWSLLDNFEWGHGYSKRFGLLHVDYATQGRTPRASARFYRRVIETRGAVLDAPPPAPADLPDLPAAPAR